MSNGNYAGAVIVCLTLVGRNGSVGNGNGVKLIAVNIKPGVGYGYALNLMKRN